MFNFWHSCGLEDVQQYIPREEIVITHSYKNINYNHFKREAVKTLIRCTFYIFDTDSM